MTAYWKFLLPGAVSPFAGFSWAGVANDWVDGGSVEPCRAGIHACRSGDLAFWLLPELWRIELDGIHPVPDGDHKVVARRGRLLERVEAWSADIERELALDCVQRTALHAAAELRAVGEHSAAEELASPRDLSSARQRAVLADTGSTASARAVAAGQRGAGRLAAYVADAVEYLDDCPVATIAYIAARAAHERSGHEPDRDGHDAEREWQSRWMVERLRLEVSDGAVSGS